MSKTHKKGRHVESASEEVKKDQCQHQIFKLEYLSQTMNYIVPDRGLSGYYLDIDNHIFNTIINGDLNNLGLNFIDKVKSMKHKCDDDLYIKDLQEAGDFINYDYPKEYKSNILSIETELKEDHDKKMAIKRIREQFPQAPESMTSSEVEIWKKKINNSIMDSYISNSSMIPQEHEHDLERYPLYREMFKIPKNYIKPQQKKTQGSLKHEKAPQKKQSVQHGISTKLRSVEQQQHKEKKQNKSKKILKLPKRAEAKPNSQDNTPSVNIKSGIYSQQIQRKTEDPNNQMIAQKVGNQQIPQIQASEKMAVEQKVQENQSKNKAKISEYPQSSEAPKAKKKHNKISKEDKQKQKTDKKQKPKEKKTSAGQKHNDKEKKEQLSAQQLQSRQIMVLPTDVRQVSIGIQTQKDEQQIQSSLKKEELQEPSNKQQPSLIAPSQIKISENIEDDLKNKSVEDSNKHQSDRAQPVEGQNIIGGPFNIPDDSNRLSLPGTYVPQLPSITASNLANNIDNPISSNGNDEQQIDVGEYLNYD